MKIWTATITAMLLLTSCATTQQPPASLTLEFELTRPLQIPANSAHTNFENGRTSAGRNLFAKHCEFEINTVRETPQTVLPDTFRVSRAMRRVVGDEQTGMPRFPFGFFGCTEQYYETHFWLSSQQQPGVRKLICREGFNFCDGRHMTLGEIQQVLGTQIVIKNAADLML